MNTQQAVANRLMQLCAERRMTINKLASLAAIPPSTVKNILSGKSQNPGIVTLKKLCDGFEIALGQFFATPEFDGLEQEIR